MSIRDSHQRFRLFDLANRFQTLSQDGRVAHFPYEDYFELINYYDEQNQRDTSLQVIDHALVYHEYSVEFYVRRAELLIDQHQEEQALLTLQTAEKLSPSTLSIALLRSVALSKLDLFDDALECLNDVKQTAGRSERSDIYYYEARVLERCKQYDRAYDALKISLRYHSENEHALRGLFSLQYFTRWGECRDLFEQAVHRNSYNANAWYALGEIHSVENDPHRAIECFENAYLSNPGFTDAYKRTAEEWINIGNPREALKCFEEIRRHLSRDFDSLLKVGHCYEQLGNYQMAIETLRHALEIGFDDAEIDEVHFVIGKCYAATGNHRTAISFYNTALKIEDRREEYYLEAGRSCEQIGKLRRADQFFRQAAIIGAESYECWNELALFYLRHGKTERALLALDEGLLHSGMSPIYYCRAVVLLKANRRKEGLRAFHEALECEYDEHELFFEMLPEYDNDTEVLALIRTLAPL